MALYEYGSLAYRRAGPEAAGIDVDIVAEVARRTGCRFETFVDSRVRTWTDLAHGSLDMTVSAIEMDERKGFARFVIYMTGRNRLLVRSDLPDRVATLDAFAERPELRLAVVKGFKHGPQWDPWIAMLHQQGRVDEYADARQAARLVALGRDAAFLSEPVVWKRILTDSKLQGRITVIDAFPGDNYAAGFALSRARVREDDARRIQEAISAMRSDGTLLKIFSAYLSRGEALSSLP
ncbi:substrate-binding periplasmic protein [Roseateles sp. NT4]|uniref:substrate-binding periplasmic protein n=1 Tax=Roseateles sp. NT4 TaxID=3453715 RepID=UPI003F6EA4AD